MRGTRVQVTPVQVQGFEALTLSNGLLALTIVPALGGKISSLRDLRSGREWLHTNARLPYRRLPYGTSYVREADTGGWDECFPTVAPCAYPHAPWRGTPLPDHGELWPQAWPVDVSAEGEGSVTVRGAVQGRALPYAFHRAITVRADAPAIRIAYRVDNRSDAPLCFIWSAHPLFAVEPGMGIVLPDRTPMHAYLTVPEGLLADDAALPWPVHVHVGGQDWSLEHMPERAAGFACKLWSERLAEGMAALEAPDGALRFSFDPAVLPGLGLWVNAGGWSGTGGAPYYNLALEPCIGAQDALEEAVERYSQYGLLPPRGMREWWLEARLDSLVNPAQGAVQD